MKISKQEVAILVALVIFLAGIFGGIYLLNIYPNQKFCEREFPDVSRFVCVFSDKYRYDGN